MKVCVLGLGYIGFPTACLIAQAGHEVIGVDVDASVVSRLEAGKLHIVNEKGLADLAQEAFESGRLTVASTVQPADVFIIAVPTPFQDHNHAVGNDLPEGCFAADLSYVEAATQSIATAVRPGNLVILESTVPPGTTENCVVKTLESAGIDTSELLFAHAPERVLPGNIVHELLYNDRILGALTTEAGNVAADLYKTFVKGRVIVTDAKTAELVKLMENTYRDVNIALSNEFALVCKSLGIDVWEAISLANLHPRVNFLRPGPGVGGHCIAVDPYFVIEVAPNLTPLVQTARKVNRSMPRHVVGLFQALCSGVQVRKVAVLGAAYKANVGDDRESPALEVVALLEELGIEVEVHDPFIDRYAKRVEDVVAGATVIILLTDHCVYLELDPSEVSKYVSEPLLLDARGHLDSHKWKSAGFTVVQLGVPVGDPVTV